MPQQIAHRLEAQPAQPALGGFAHTAQAPHRQVQDEPGPSLRLEVAARAIGPRVSPGPCPLGSSATDGPCAPKG